MILTLASHPISTPDPQPNPGPNKVEPLHALGMAAVAQLPAEQQVSKLVRWPNCPPSSRPGSPCSNPTPEPQPNPDPDPNADPDPDPSHDPSPDPKQARLTLP
eukprot:scaffold11735_cov56-Phaeocystis_antarctica.AAC.4